MPASLLQQHFFAPLNVGEIENPEAIGSAASVACGALLRVSLSVDEAQRITAARFRVAGCSYLVATCSFLTTTVSGKTTGEAAVLCQQPAAVVAAMDNDWPEDKAECVALACQAFVAAIRNYSDTVRDEWSEDEALICTCFGVSDRAIETAIHTHGLHTIAEVTKVSNAGAGCQSCHPLIEDILDQFARGDDPLFNSPH